MHPPFFYCNTKRESVFKRSLRWHLERHLNFFALQQQKPPQCQTFFMFMGNVAKCMFGAILQRNQDNLVTHKTIDDAKTRSISIRGTKQIHDRSSIIAIKYALFTMNAQSVIIKMLSRLFLTKTNLVVALQITLRNLFFRCQRVLPSQKNTRGKIPQRRKRQIMMLQGRF